jgi:hypothetical protein
MPRLVCKSKVETRVPRPETRMSLSAPPRIRLALLALAALLGTHCSDEQVPAAYVLRGDAWDFVNDCFAFAPCESDISGDWDVSCDKVYYNSTFNGFTSACPTAPIETQVAVTGTLSFVPTSAANPGAGKYTYTLTEAGKVSFTMLPNCLTSLDRCSEMNSEDMDAGVSGLTCDGDPASRCRCEMTFSGQPRVETGGYSVVGGSLTTSGAQMGTPDAYCVTGDKLKVKLNSVLGVTAYLTATRHGT